MKSTPRRLIESDPYMNMMFLQFVEKKLGMDHELILFMKAVDGFKHAGDASTRLAIALEVWDQFLTPGAKYEVRLPSSSSPPPLERSWTGLVGNVALVIKRANERHLQGHSSNTEGGIEDSQRPAGDHEVPADVFDSMKEAVFALFEERFLPAFEKSSLFQKATAKGGRAKGPVNAVEEQLLSGSRKIALSQWWLLLIRSNINDFLINLGFVQEAIPDNYTMEPPRDIPLVRRNRKILAEIVAADDIHGVQKLAKELCDIVYPKIEIFISDCRRLLLRKAGLLLHDNAAEITLAELLDHVKSKPFTAEEHERLEDLVKDLLYLQKMKALEESKGGGTRDLDVVPISGIIMGTFARLENECKTVLELWDWEYPFTFVSVEELLANPEARSAFRGALSKPSRAPALHLVQLWEAIRAFKVSCSSLPGGGPAAEEACRAKAYRIRQAYLAPSADVPIPSIPKSVKTATLSSLSKTTGAPKSDVFDEVEKLALKELQPNFERFMNSSKYTAFKEQYNPAKTSRVRSKELKALKKNKKNKSTECLSEGILIGPAFTEADWGLVTLKTPDQKFEYGDQILKEGQEMTSFLYIRSGVVTVFTTNDAGKTIPLARRKAGEFLGELSFLSKGCHRASATVVAGDRVGRDSGEGATVSVIPVERLSRNLISDCALASKFFRMICLELSKSILVPRGSLTSDTLAGAGADGDTPVRRMSSLTLAVEKAAEKPLFSDNARLGAAAKAICEFVGIELVSEEQVLASFQCRHARESPEKKKKKRAGLLVLMTDFVGFFAKAFASKTVVVVPVSCLVQVALPAKGGTAVRAVEERVQGTVSHVFTFSDASKAQAAGAALKNYLVINSNLSDASRAAAKKQRALASQKRPSDGVLGRRKTPSSSMLHTFVFSNESWDAILSSCSELKKCSNGDVVLHEGQAPDCMYQLLSGSVRVKKGPRFITTLHEGALFGEISFMLQQTASADVVVHSQTAVVLCLKLEPLRKLLNKDPKLGACFFYYLATVLCPRVLAMNDEAIAP